MDLSLSWQREMGLFPDRTEPRVAVSNKPTPALSPAGYSEALATKQHSQDRFTMNPILNQDVSGLPLLPPMIPQQPQHPRRLSVVSSSSSSSGRSSTTSSGAGGSSIIDWLSLPPDFQPHEFSVLCGQEKQRYRLTPGNRRLGDLCRMHIEKYARANTKGGKSTIVCEIYSIIQESCPNGQGVFIKNIDGSWYECSMKMARRKITSTLRECLPDRYPSSNASRRERKAKRKLEQESAENGESFRRLGEDDDELVPIPLLDKDDDDWSLLSISSHVFDDGEDDFDVSLSSISPHVFDDDDGENDFLIQTYPELLKDFQD
jgi:hypothetical protein